MKTDPKILTDKQILDPLKPLGIKGFRETALAAGRAIEQATRQAYESQLLRLLVDIRFAAGDNGKRMQDELVEHIAGLRKDAGRYRHLRDNGDLSPRDLFNAWWLSDHGNPQTLDAAIDAAMQEQKT